MAAEPLAHTPDLDSLDKLDILERLAIVRRSTTSLALAIKGADLDPVIAACLRELALEIRDSLDALTADIEQEKGRRAFIAGLIP
jgi:hypothetical protein